MKPEAQVPLRFASHAVEAQTHVNLSAIRSDESVLWIAGDETATVERLTAADGAYQTHATFPLAKVIALPGGPEDEVDVEGLARQGPYLWAVGSHSSRRKKIKDKHDDEKSVRRLARVSDEPSRRVVARLAVTPDDDGLPGIVDEAPGGHTSAILPGGISAVLDEDEHLAPFLAIPGKDNGFDVEGVAVRGDSLYLGLRGPVLRGWAVVLEVVPVDAAQPGRLELAALDDDRLYRKHFLDLGGLGIRDLSADGDDLLVLAGPSMDLDGPVRVYRWHDALGGEDPPQVVREQALSRELDLPYGEGVDHAEGIALLPDRRLLVVYDSPAPERLIEPGTVLADVFALAHP
ncbi:MAG TPA: DUF3616 domain-containing protein [Pseudonocardiaceae bacterium]|nr:DUF3616 domain-containing protein [Pseudonocardiaceae bacterium]